MADDDETRITLRLVGDLREQLGASAAKAGRSLNAEIQHLLRMALEEYPYRVRDLEKRLGKAGDEIDRMRNIYFGGRSDVTIKDVLREEFDELQRAKDERAAEEAARAARIDRLMAAVEPLLVKRASAGLEQDVRRIISVIDDELAGNIDSNGDPVDLQSSMGRVLGDAIDRRTAFAMELVISSLKEAGLLSDVDLADEQASEVATSMKRRAWR